MRLNIMKKYDDQQYNYMSSMGIITSIISKNHLSRFSIFLLTIAFTSSSLYANTQMSDDAITTSENRDNFYPLIEVIATHDLIRPPLMPSSSVSQVTSTHQYQTYKPGNEPNLTIWTMFPGPYSRVIKPTVFNTNTIPNIWTNNYESI